MQVTHAVVTDIHGSFTQAADSLNYSQSGISRMIHDLELEWNVCLLERSRSGVRLTSDGFLLLPTIQKICNEYDQLQLQVNNLNGLQSGYIRIGTFSSVATHWLPNIIKDFQKDYPNIDYELLLGDYTEIEKWIQEGRVDCGFLRLPTYKEFDTRFLKKDKLLVILPVDHPLSKYDKIPIQALCNDPFILLEKSAKEEISNIFEKYKVSPKVHFTTWDDYAVMSMVESGLGISILPELILKRISYNLVIKELDVDAYRDIGIAFRNESSTSLAIQKFSEYTYKFISSI